MYIASIIIYSEIIFIIPISVDKEVSHDQSHDPGVSLDSGRLLQTPIPSWHPCQLPTAQGGDIEVWLQFSKALWDEHEQFLLMSYWKMCRWLGSLRKFPYHAYHQKITS